MRAARARLPPSRTQRPRDARRSRSRTRRWPWCAPGRPTLPCPVSLLRSAERMRGMAPSTQPRPQPTLGLDAQTTRAARRKLLRKPTTSSCRQVYLRLGARACCAVLCMLSCRKLHPGAPGRLCEREAPPAARAGVREVARGARGAVRRRAARAGGGARGGAGGRGSRRAAAPGHHVRHEARRAVQRLGGRHPACGPGRRWACFRAAFTKRVSFSTCLPRCGGPAARCGAQYGSGSSELLDLQASLHALGSCVYLSCLMFKLQAPAMPRVLCSCTSRCKAHWGARPSAAMVDLSSLPLARVAS